MKALSSSARWLIACGIVGLAACSGKLHAGSGEPNAGTSGAGGSGASETQTNHGAIVGAPAHCPAAQPQNGDACDVERAACGYTGSELVGSDMLAWECYCAESPSLELRWFCMDRGLRSPDCPAARVKSGQSCPGLYGTRCSYLVGEQCGCDASQTWDCFNIRPEDLPSAPAVPTPSTPINELTEANRSAWCAWYRLAQGPSDPLQQDDVPIDGILQNPNCGIGYGPACNVAFALLSPRQCAQNLAVSSCTAAIADLTDCITTTRNGCVPEPHGCARLLASPGCSGTIVNDLGPNGALTGGTGNFPAPSKCSLRVE